ncbi:MAG: hypothetical protein NW220_08000 [Leptolyngbyaceae cyanobacterium bins.349]|nr:hypothetical protein [Leptolyngbyaceae cyanobacterium bins.349]
MASVERIEQDIATLNQATSDLARELQQGYSEYLKALGQALRQQLVLSGYHVCTQGYPTQFLALSLSQRQQLQQALRDLAKATQAKLLSLLHHAAVGETTATDDADVLDANALDTNALDANDLDVNALDANAHLPTASPERSLTPMALSQWQEALEAAIAHEFQAVSFKANRLLQQSGVLPNKLPEFLKATSGIDAERIEAISQNMLELLVEAQSRDDAADEDDDSMSSVEMVVQLVAVHLKLTDVEFADGTTTVLRNRLRSLIVRLKQLKHTFHRKERELAIARAEDAWRSSWFDD